MLASSSPALGGPVDVRQEICEMSTVAFPIRLVRKIVRENVRGIVRDSVRERVCEQRHERRGKKRSSAALKSSRAMTAYTRRATYIHVTCVVYIGDGKDASRVEGNGEVAIHLADARWDPIASGEGGSPEMRRDAMRCDAPVALFELLRCAGSRI